MILFYTFLILLFIFLSFNKQTYYLMLYIITSTKFLGFLDFSSVTLLGLEIGFFGINFLTFTLAFFSIARNKIKSNLKIKSFIIVIIFLLIYGIIKPVIQNESTLLQSLISSKDYWYYSILFYVLFNLNKIDVIKIFKFFKILGLYLASMCILGLILPTAVAPFYYSDSHVRVAYSSYVTLAIFLFAAEYKVRRFNFSIISKIIFCFIGLIISNRVNLNLSTLLGIFLLIYGFDINLKIKKINIYKIPVFFFIAIFFGLIFNFKIFADSYNFALSILEGSNNSIVSREIYNEFRIDAINNKKWFGYGFIHHSTDLMNSFDTYSSNRFMKSFGVIDSGYIDFIIKFGWVGLITYFIFFSRFLLNSYKNLNKSVYSLSMLIFLSTYFMINYTWSVFTYPVGILPMAIAVLIIFKNVELKNKNLVA